jgi:cation diffusion facilitator family transporter
VAEAIHSGVDLLAALIALYAVRSSGKPADEGHPYGHGKVENVSGTVEALLIFLAAALIVYESVEKIINGVELPAVDLGLGVMALSAVANWLVSLPIKRVARSQQSVALEADAYHHTTDVITSIGVFAGLAAVKVTGVSILDPLVAIVVAGFIAKAAWDITRRSFVDLLDRSLPDEERRVIGGVMDRHRDLFCGYHHLRSRRSGNQRYIEMHLLVQGEAHVADAHALTDHLQDEIRRELGPATVAIHIEPCIRDCENCPAARMDDGACTLERHERLAHELARDRKAPQG